MSFGALTFLTPLALLGLLALPLVWWILRISPPKPRLQIFPPLRILQGVKTEEETPSGTPLWLLLFRLLMVAIASVALAQPLLSQDKTETSRPLTLIIDTSVTAAPLWDDIIDEAERLTKEAQRKNLDVQIIAGGDDEPAGFMPAREAVERLKSLQPQSVMTSFPNLSTVQGDVAFLSSGLIRTDFDVAMTNVTVYTPDVQPILIPGDVRETAQGFEADWTRPGPKTTTQASVEALGADGSVIAVADLDYTGGKTLATARFDLPAQLRAKVARLRLSGVRSAASVKLLDDAFGRPLVGVLRPSADTSSPLLSEPFYAQQALEPYADVFEGDLETLLELQPSLIVMPDSLADDNEAVRTYLDTGGLIIRFAGPRLAKSPDRLIPVELRTGGRAIGGALAWEQPQRLDVFSDDSPFAGLAVPTDVTISKQVMAEPGIETDTRTWARLEDGSPVVTSSIEGSGRLVLFHVTAGPDWSNLALSGLYVDMLRRILPLAKGRAVAPSKATGDWTLERALGPFGELQAAPAFAQTIPQDGLGTARASAERLPGYYRQGTRITALPAIESAKDIAPLDLPRSVRTARYGEASDSSLAGWGLGIALAMLAIDALLALIASGRLAYLRPGQGVTALLLASIMFSFSPDVFAQDENDRIQDAATGLHLAYIETGKSGTDELSNIAMQGLVEQLTGRTTIEPVGVHAVQAEDKGLELYPFLYWPVGRDAPALSDAARKNLNAYMASGGTIVFDTADEGDRLLRAGAPHPGLARITEGLDIPRLGTVPEDHVLTKSFYLMQSYPGRWANGPVYVQVGTGGGNGRDGVSPVIIGGNDWAAGWAVTTAEGAQVELENDMARQREMAMRFGVNLVMYTLSGNYKSDQVHAAALVERLGRGSEGPMGTDDAPNSTPQEVD